MGNRAKFWLLGSIPLVLIVGLVGAGLWHLPQLDVTAALQWQLLAGLIGGAALLGIVILALWGYLDWACLAPLGTLSRGARIIAHGNPGYEMELPRTHLLGELPGSVRELGQALHEARRERVAATAAGAREVEEQKIRLEIVLRELSEGVLVCDAEARILLYNPAALKLLPNPEALAPGCSLYSLWTRAPIESTLELLRQRQQHASAARGAGGDAEFVCATVDGQLLLHCRMSLLPASAPHRAAVVITFRDLASQFQPLGPGRPQFDASLEDLRRPLASLRAAAENLSRAPDLEPGQRHAFQRILVAESVALSRNLEALARELRSLFAAQWPMNDVYSADLLAGVVRHLEQRVGPRVTPVGPPRWLHVDSHSIMLLIEHLIEQVYACGAASQFEIECLLGNRRVYLDIIWQGRPLPVPRVQAWAGQRLQDLVGATTVGEVLARHNSELWSQGHRKPGHALLRLPLPASRRQWQAGGDELPAGRPEVYELSLGDEHEALGALAERPLAELCCVAFDTETTGLEPAKGDEIIQIAGVRIVNRRIMADETFERLTNPGKPIPRTSVRFHGITDDQVRDKPPVETVLKQFKSFVGDADTVLISHNAAFDLKFLKLKEDGAGLRFDNPVLDTLLLSAYVHDYTDAHTLEAIAERLGVTVRDRHTALGDAMITAQIFVRLLPLLEAHGVKTLGQALEASDKMAEIRKLQAQF